MAKRRDQPTHTDWPCRLAASASTTSAILRATDFTPVTVLPKSYLFAQQ